jgi:hypothetical protein
VNPTSGIGHDLIQIRPGEPQVFAEEGAGHLSAGRATP